MVRMQLGIVQHTVHLTIHVHLHMHLKTAIYICRVYYIFHNPLKRKVVKPHAPTGTHMHIRMYMRARAHTHTHTHNYTNYTHIEVRAKVLLSLCGG